jgi:hypothetical protein
VQALQNADLVDLLSGDELYTVIAPVNNAFLDLDLDEPGALQALLNDPVELRAVLEYHIIPGDYPRNRLNDFERLDALDGEPVIIDQEGRQLFVSDVLLEETDIIARNGVIHTVEALVYPPDFCEVDADCGEGQVCDEGGLCAFSHTCDAPIELPVGQPQLGNTADSESFEFSSCGNAGEAPDHVWRFTAPDAGAYCATTQGSDFATVLHVRAGECVEPGAEIACAEDGDAVAFDAEAGVDYFVIVDGDNVAGQYFLTLVAGACP